MSSSAEYHQDHPRYDYDSSVEKIRRIIDLASLSNKKILDLGCGDGRLASQLTHINAEPNQVYGLDAAPEAVKEAIAKGVIASVGDIESKLPFDDNTFDVVLLLDTLEHLYNVESVFKEVHRILKPDGQFVFSFLNAFDVRNRLRLLFGGSIIHWAHEKYRHNEVWSYCHIRFPRLVDVVKVLNREGLDLDKVQYNFLGGGLISQRFTPGFIRMWLLRIWPNLMTGKFVCSATKAVDKVVRRSVRHIWISKTPLGL